MIAQDALLVQLICLVDRVPTPPASPRRRGQREAANEEREENLGRQEVTGAPRETLSGGAELSPKETEIWADSAFPQTARERPFTNAAEEPPRRLVGPWWRRIFRG
jgi:hypothetical protein